MPGLRQHVERRASGRGAHGIAVQRVGRPDDVGARTRPCVEHRHHVGAAGDGRQRKSAAHRLAVAREVGHDAVLLLRAAPRDAKAGDDFVEDEDDAVAARDLAHGLEKAGLGQQHALQRLDDHRGELVRMALDHRDGLLPSR